MGQRGHRPVPGPGPPQSAAGGHRVCNGRWTPGRGTHCLAELVGLQLSQPQHQVRTALVSLRPDIAAGSAQGTATLLLGSTLHSMSHRLSMSLLPSTYNVPSQAALPVQCSVMPSPGCSAGLMPEAPLAACSVLIHLLPGLAVWAHRHFPAPRDVHVAAAQAAHAVGWTSFGAPAVQQPQQQAPSWLLMLAAPLLFYAVWQALYWVIVQVGQAACVACVLPTSSLSSVSIFKRGCKAPAWHSATVILKTGLMQLTSFLASRGCCLQAHSGWPVQVCMHTPDVPNGSHDPSCLWCR